MDIDMRERLIGSISDDYHRISLDERPQPSALSICQAGLGANGADYTQQDRGITRYRETRGIDGILEIREAAYYRAT